MNDWKEVFSGLATDLREATDGKTVVFYEHQKGNGNFIFVNSQDNEGRGIYIGVEGYKEAAHIVEGMLYMASIDRNGTIWSPRKEK